MKKRDLSSFGKIKPESSLFASSITVGLEFEVHRVEPLIKGAGKNKKISKTAEVYQKQLEDAKLARIINDLGIQDFYPDLAKHTA